MALNIEEIAELVKQFEDESKAIRKEILKMCWYMRGGVSYTDILNMSQGERDEIGKLIESNLETTKKSQLPFF